jgi:hypothetical protein
VRLRSGGEQHDTAGLEQDVIDEALRSHPVVTDAHEARRSPTYTATAEPFHGTLPEPLSQAIDRSRPVDRESAL